MRERHVPQLDREEPSQPLLARAPISQEPAEDWIIFKRSCEGLRQRILFVYRRLPANDLRRDGHAPPLSVVRAASAANPLKISTSRSPKNSSGTAAGSISFSSANPFASALI